MAGEYVTCEIKGLDELQRKLSDMGKECKPIVREGLKAGASEFQNGIMEMGGGVGGELGAQLGVRKTWKIKTKVRSDEVAGTATVQPTGSLPELHHSFGHGKQPKGKWYHRSISYMVKLMEFGGGGGDYHGPRLAVMTGGFESSRNRALDAVIAKIKERLKL
jgi:hypothetical protein